MLLTGFAPFAGSRVNASERIVRRLEGTSCGACPVVGAVLPCLFDEAFSELRQALCILRPVMVVCLGEARRAAITPERMSANWDEARMPDNRGRQPRGTPVVAGAPPGYPSRLPVLRIVKALKRRRIAAEVSDCAGAYVCNHVFFALMHHLAQRLPCRRPVAGFIHVPAQRGAGGIGLHRQSKAIELAIRASLSPAPGASRY